MAENPDIAIDLCHFWATMPIDVPSARTVRQKKRPADITGWPADMSGTAVKSA